MLDGLDWLFAVVFGLLFECLEQLLGSAQGCGESGRRLNASGESQQSQALPAQAVTAPPLYETGSRRPSGRRLSLERRCMAQKTGHAARDRRHVIEHGSAFPTVGDLVDQRLGRADLVQRG